MLNYWRTLPQRLSRITSGGKLISEIDGFRFLAIFPVVVNHLSQRIQRHSEIQFDTPLEEDPFFFWVSRGYIGIYVFFVISGFILSLPFASHAINQTRAISLKDYFIRRLTRLEPPYIIIMSVFFIALLAANQFSLRELFPHYMASIFYVHNIIYKIWSPLNPVAWTLEVEVQFYILAPFLAMLLFSIKNIVARRIVLVSLIFVLVGVQQYFGWMKYPWSFYIIGQLHFFLIGFVLTDIYLCDWKESRSPSIIFDVIGILCLLGIFILISYDFVNRLLYPVVLFLLFYAIFRSIYVLRFFRNPWIAGIGGMCYTIYLIHLPLAEIFERAIGNFGITNYYIVNLLVQLIIFLPLVFIVSVVFFLLIEKPCMDKEWPKKLSAHFSNYYKKFKY